jgi:hypothetical protein
MHGKMQNKMKMKYFVFCKKKGGGVTKGSCPHVTVNVYTFCLCLMMICSAFNRSWLTSKINVYIVVNRLQLSIKLEALPTEPVSLT